MRSTESQPRHPARHGAHRTGHGMCPVFESLLGFLAVLSQFCFLPVSCHLPFSSFHEAAGYPDASLSIARERMRERGNTQEET